MASIKLKFLKSTNSLIVLLISLLGFSSSCKKEDQKYMYGVPHANYIISGVVKSAADDQAVPEIIVEIRSIDRIQEGQAGERLVGTGFTYFDGNYSSTVYGDSGEQSYHVKFIDTDGALNGEYETLDTTIVFKNPKYTDGDGSWYRGIAEQELNVKLKPKK